MITKEKLVKTINEIFPYSKPFTGQIEAIIEICESFIFENKKHVILDAPTGSGKSVIAWTIMNTLHQLGIIRKGQVITTTKALQTLYTTSFPEMNSLKAKTNYHCPHGQGCYLSPECKMHTKINGCKSKEECPYVLARETWCDRSTFRLTNTSFMLEAGSSLVKDGGRFADFMVIDEAHRLEEMIIEHSKFIFSTHVINEVSMINSYIPSNNLHSAIIRLLNYLGQKSYNSEGHMSIYDEETKNLVKNLSEELVEFSQKILEYCNSLDPRDKEDEKAIEYLNQSLEVINSMYENTILLLEHIELGTRFNIYINTGYLEIKIIDARVSSINSLFSKSDKFLHMSGTICGYEYHISKLGINKDEAKFIKIDNHIPENNRTIRALGNFRIRGNDYNSNQKAIVYVDRILDHYYNQHGFIFCPSYEMCETYYKYSSHQKRLRLPSNTEEAFEILSKDDDSVVISPALIEGIDLKGDMCRFQIIPRIPYLYLGDDIVKIKLQTEPEFYYRTTIMKLVQICGRGIRGVDDYCDTYIFDQTFKSLITRNNEYVPDWFEKAIKWYF